MHHLHPKVHSAVVGSDLVLLDLRSGRYYCLADCAPLLKAGSGGRTLEPGQRQIPCFEPAILSPQLTPVWPPPRPTLEPTSDLLHLAMVPQGRPSAGRFLAATSDALLRYPRRTFGALVAEAVRSRSPSVIQDPQSLASAIAFNGFAPYLPVGAKCLLRSYLLLRQLWREGLDAAWVFGVRTYPFAAHCWLQSGEVVLDDHWERVSAYQPILAV